MTIDDVEFDEWVIPAALGAFPDQIGADARGALWISQPNNNQVLCFEPRTETWVAYPATGGGKAPDGMIVASDGVIWTGLLTSGHLGRVDPLAGTFTSIPPPPGVPSLAIPNETSRGTIMATSHGGKLVEYDPATHQWILNVKVPTPNCWLLAGAEDPATGIVWLVEHWAGLLARYDPGGGPITELDLPGGDTPGFLDYGSGRIWIASWSTDRMLRFNPANGNFKSISFGLSGEPGGPMDVAPNGDVVVGTRGDGWVVVYRQQLGRRYRVPGPNPNMKDGLTVDGDGDVWFTARNGRRIIRMRYPH